MALSESDSSLTVREAAAFLGAHIETVRRLARRGAIPSFKVGKDWRFRKEALLRWSETQGGPAPSEDLVLIVDDEENVCRMLAEIVRKLGFRPLSCTDARGALALLATNDPSLVLLDLRMPNMTGPQFLRELRQTHPNLPVVIVTGHPDGQLMQDAAQFPPLMLLPKPLSSGQVQQTIRAVLGERGPAATARPR